MFSNSSRYFRSDRRRFGGLTLRDIRHHGEDNGVALSGLEKNRTGQHPNFGTIGAPQTAIQLFAYPDAAILKPYALYGQIFEKEKVCQPATRDLTRLASENLRHARVGITDHPIGIDHPDAFASGFDKVQLPVFTLCRTILRETHLSAIKAQTNGLSSVEQVVNPRAGLGRTDERRSVDTPGSGERGCS